MADGSWSEQLIAALPGHGGGGFQDLVGGIVMDKHGNLFWTNGETCGAVYELMPKPDSSWSLKKLHAFEEGSDGCQPNTTLTFDAEGNLYGTTFKGGLSDGGTVFEVSPGANGEWMEKIVWRFQGYGADGLWPLAGVVVDRQGNLFGTTSTGGPTSGGSEAYGTVFELTPQPDGSWKETVIHTFNFSPLDPDGARPEGDMIFDGRGNLYGTAFGGGSDVGGGIVFELTPTPDGTWSETILHHFSPSGAEGYGPTGNIVFSSSGNLLGTTFDGGGTPISPSMGTLYELKLQADASWSLRVVHRFREFGDGYQPEAGVSIDPSGNLYGTTVYGGPLEDGAVFEVANPDIAAVPTFSPSGGTYTSTQKVRITDSTPGAKIYYTTNGDEPSAESSDEYSGPIEVKHTETIKAIAVAEGLSDSGLASAKFVIHLPAATPEIKPPADTYHTPKVVTISDATSDPIIYYTTNGQTPTTASKIYRYPFRIYATTTIKAIAIAPGHSQSKVASDTIVIHLPSASATYTIQP
jgi:uncharacterized repeat protein (TIGR03803 family)